MTDRLSGRKAVSGPVTRSCCRAVLRRFIPELLVHEQFQKVETVRIELAETLDPYCRLAYRFGVQATPSFSSGTLAGHQATVFQHGDVF